jgi:DNA repair protein RecO
MKTIRTKAIVIRRTNYGEADRILQLLTPEYGKLSVMARGVRREKSKLAGGIELFATSDITVTSGKGDLSILTGSRLVKFYGGIMHDYDRLTFGYEVLKQVSRAADAIDEPAFYDLLEQGFMYLEDSDIQLNFVRVWFWLQLGILLGHGLNLSTDDSGMKLVEDARYNFDESQGVFAYRENGRFTSDHIKLLRLMSAQSPKVATKVQGAAELLEDCLWVAERSFGH